MPFESSEFHTFNESNRAVCPMDYKLFTNNRDTALGSGALVLIYTRQGCFHRFWQVNMVI